MALLQRLSITTVLLLLEPFCVQSQCSGFTCSDGTCLASASQRCDSQTQCPDKSDERNCSDCRLGYPCENGQCTFLVNRCNSRNDCTDGYDELNCHVTSTPLTSTVPSQDYDRLGLTIGIPVSAAIIVALPIIACVIGGCILCCIAKSKRTSVHLMPSGATTMTRASNKAKSSTSKSDHRTPSIHQQKSNMYVHLPSLQSKQSPNQIKPYQSKKSHTESAVEMKSLEQKKSEYTEQNFPQVIEVHPVPLNKLPTSQVSVKTKPSDSDQSKPRGYSESEFSRKPEHSVTPKLSEKSSHHSY